MPTYVAVCEWRSLLYDDVKVILTLRVDGRNDQEAEGVVRQRFLRNGTMENDKLKLRVTMSVSEGKEAA